MTSIINQLKTAQGFAMAHRPAVGGFPFLAEVLRLAGVKSNHWVLPACQSEYVFESGSVIQQMPPLGPDIQLIPPFDPVVLVAALRKDQAGQSTFFEFLQATWDSGVIRYTVDFNTRAVSYFGAGDSVYVESYPLVRVDGFSLG